FLEFQNVAHIIASDTRSRGSDLGLGENDILKVTLRRRDATGPLVDLFAIQQVIHRKILRAQDSVHSLQAERSLAIQKVGNVGLLESGLLRQAEPAKFLRLDALP